MVLQITGRGQDAEAGWDESLDGRLSSAGLVGATVEHGLLRFHTGESASQAHRVLDLHLQPGTTEGWAPFAVDWRGRQYCRVQQTDVDAVVRVDPGADLPAQQTADFPMFMDTVLVDPRAAASLGAEECAAALAGRGIATLGFDQCFGYIMPPFAGGEDRPSNLIDVPVAPYWAAMADLRNQWEQRPVGAFAVGVAHRQSGLNLVYDVDQDPEFSLGAGTHAADLTSAFIDGRMVYNHGLAREVAGDQAADLAALIQQGIGQADPVAAPFLVDWRARCYVRESAGGADVVARYDPVTLTRDVLGSAEEFLVGLSGGSALLEVFGEAEKSRACARLRLAEIPADQSLVPPVPGRAAGEPTVDPDAFRPQLTDVYWWIAATLRGMAGEAGPGVHLHGYALDPEGELHAQQAPGAELLPVPAPWEDRAGVPPERVVVPWARLIDDGVLQTGMDDDRLTPDGDDVAQRLMHWYRLPGRVFNRGLFRFLGRGPAELAREHLDLAFPDADSARVPVLVDWLGRYLASETVDGQRRLVSYDVARGDREDLAPLEVGLRRLLLTPVPLALFDAEGFVHARAALGTGDLEPGMCVGVRRPLFLGGPEGAENWTVDTLDVHWVWNGSILQQVRALPPGTVVRSVEVAPDGKPLVVVDEETGAAAVDRRDSSGGSGPAGGARGGSRGIFTRLFKG